jgi:hypothetical protein
MRIKKSPRFIKNIRILEIRPSRLFADYDRDGVANIFDCRPRNRFRQDSEEWQDAEENEKNFERFEDIDKTDTNITNITKGWKRRDK